jgi:hypothetical protein
MALLATFAADIVQNTVVRRDSARVSGSNNSRAFEGQSPHEDGPWPVITS